jgi:hypothetical protein
MAMMAVISWSRLFPADGDDRDGALPLDLKLSK